MTNADDTNTVAESIEIQQNEIKQKTSEVKASNAFLKATTTTMVPPNELVVDINQLQQREREMYMLTEQQQTQQQLLQQQLILQQQQQQIQQLQQIQMQQLQQQQSPSLEVDQLQATSSIPNNNLPQYIDNPLSANPLNNTTTTSFVPSILKQSVTEMPRLQQSVLLPANPLRQTLLNPNTLTGLSTAPLGTHLQQSAIMAPATSPPLVITSPTLASAAQSSNTNPGATNTLVLPCTSIVTPALANIVAIPAEVSEITPMTPVTAIPAHPLTVPPSPLGLSSMPQVSPRSPGNPLGATLSLGGNPLGGTLGGLGATLSLNNPLGATYNNLVNNNNNSILSTSNAFHSSSLKTIMEIPRYRSNSTVEDTVASPGYVEMKDLSKNTVIVNIPSPVVAQQTILDGADQVPLVSEILPQISESIPGGASITVADKAFALADADADKVKTKRKNRFSKEKMKKFKNSVYQILAPSTQLPIHLVDSETLETYVVPFLMELGRALLMSGVPAHRLEYELTLISSTFGIDGNFFTTPTGIFFSFGSPHTILSPYTHLLRIQSTDYNMERLVRLEALADEVIYGKKSCQTALVDLRDILKAPPLYSIYVTVFSFIVSSFAFSFFLKCGWLEVGSCSLVGLYVGLLYAAGCKWPPIGKVLEALSAFGGAIIAALINSFISPVPRFMVTLGGIIALAPGLSLTISVAEISTRNLVSGNARLMGAFSCLLQLSFGIAMGTKFSDNILPVRKEVAPDSFPAWTMFLAVPLAAVSFAIQMKASPRQMWIIMLTSILGIIGGNWGNEVFGTDVGSFFGACLICVAGNLYARFTNGTSVVPIMSGIILLVPGSMGVKGLFSVSSGNVDGGIALFGGMFMIATSLTIGLLVANLLVKPHKAL
ncbi:hypothetical protein PPL_04143 [Heterostelium album PN500]|uniref:Threonine/serine exporter-like N-terminal domain-containing protein n=1 Tax=Heterostelium pallidum (strain ATCC 26659 / Pp 5 / PN500) TaxID=670386 RepID=D3B652_HETP5|nr:hypothetical protein PPL_04143 [Heterostelium album PN500]EFA83350.1 hypothetical protein PPL_04143 [Heterostelium album PN500]|eukprot:XP_020435467.1 hypothetical protein PPL_04143 [Heterostelium album PN500]